jgi:hypothetical protein
LVAEGGHGAAAGGHLVRGVRLGTGAGRAGAAAPAPSRVDPSYVNNPSLADVTFRYNILLVPTRCALKKPPVKFWIWRRYITVESSNGKGVCNCNVVM